MAKAKSPIPQGLHSVTPSLCVEGASEALALYAKAFGAIEESRMADPSGERLWHAEFAIGDSRLFIGDASPQMGSPAYAARLMLYVADVDAAFKRAVDAGLTPTMPPADMFWGDRMAKLKDRFGNEWTLGARLEDLTAAEMKERGDAFVKQMMAQAQK